MQTLDMRLWTYLRSDKFETRELSPCLLVDDVLHLRVDLRERSVEILVLYICVNFRAENEIE